MTKKTKMNGTIDFKNDPLKAQPKLYPSPFIIFMSVTCRGWGVIGGWRGRWWAPTCSSQVLRHCMPGDQTGLVALHVSPALLGKFYIGGDWPTFPPSLRAITWRKWSDGVAGALGGWVCRTEQKLLIFFSCFTEMKEQKACHFFYQILSHVRLVNSMSWLSTGFASVQVHTLTRLTQIQCFNRRELIGMAAVFQNKLPRDKSAT